jgi:hypothetical protein
VKKEEFIQLKKKLGEIEETFKAFEMATSRLEEIRSMKEEVNKHHDKHHDDVPLIFMRLRFLIKCKGGGTVSLGCVDEIDFPYETVVSVFEALVMAEIERLRLKIETTETPLANSRGGNDENS